MTLRLQSSSNMPNTLLKWRPQIDKFMFNQSMDVDGAYMLQRMGFRFKPVDDKPGWSWVYMPAISRMTKEEKDAYLSKHPSILNKP